MTKSKEEKALEHPLRGEILEIELIRETEPPDGESRSTFKRLPIPRREEKKKKRKK